MVAAASPAKSCCASVSQDPTAATNRASSDAASALPSCYQCGKPTPAGTAPSHVVGGREQRFCGERCAEISRRIIAAELEAFYRYRTLPAAKADPAGPPDSGERPELFDHPDIQKAFVRRGEGWREAALIIDGTHCQACLWLIDRHLRQQQGVISVEMDFASERAVVRWDPDRTALGALLRAVNAIGYAARPFDTRHRERLLRDRARRDGKHLLFAGLVGMPIMQFSLASYIMDGDPADALPLWQLIGRWTSLFAAAAILLYPAQDFFLGAWRDLRNRRLGMDVPIVIGLVTAFIGSLVATISQRGEVYFDSIAMFVLFVLLARHLEMRGRVRSADQLDRLAMIVPQTARRLCPDGREETVPAVELEAGDRVRALPGEVLPADGVILEGHSSFDEAILTGEPLPVEKWVGDSVMSGTYNREQPVTIRVTRVGSDSTAGEIRRMLHEAAASRPRLALLVERAASLFVLCALLIAGGTASVWLWIDPQQALASTVSVLIVTCPCALALAAPAANTLATGRFAAMGVLPLRAEAVEALARADTVALDKTGTLTEGRLDLVELRTSTALAKDHALAIAGALEQRSEHPVAQALRRHGTNLDLGVTGYRNLPGSGVEGTVCDRRWRLGKPDFAGAAAEFPSWVTQALVEQRALGRYVVMLADTAGVQAVLAFDDRLRSGAADLAGELNGLGIHRAMILSGDASANASRVGEATGIAEAFGDLQPVDKLRHIRTLQKQGRRVIMVGDGLNDAPVLAAADASVSFADATDLARVQSDFLVLSGGLDRISHIIRLARKVRAIILQNLCWAASYNLAAVPAAALGMVPPWMAAIGMSLSSLIVVGNALRLHQRNS